MNPLAWPQFFDSIPQELSDWVHSAPSPFAPLPQLGQIFVRHFNNLADQPHPLLRRMEYPSPAGQEFAFFVTQSFTTEQDFVDTKAKVHLAKGVFVEAGATLKGPLVVKEGSELRQGCYLRGQVWLGPGCVAGHTTEMKNLVAFSHVEAGHFAYLGDSILGNYLNLGAGTKISNLELRSLGDKQNHQFPLLRLPLGEKMLETGLTKFGALLGDGVETGCNVVISPGCLMQKQGRILPNQSLLKGVYPQGVLIKTTNESKRLRL